MRIYLQISGAVFALIALGHLVRLLCQWPAMIAGRPVPGWASVLGWVVASALSVWAFRLLRRLPRH